ncbi:DUF2335 domain-containing protein [Roseinatronobacter thiooxidans]|uniref:DUF2335 domain-containing protein n=1 Tax=Roseinatronobacter thiooxidans TaxID=121821 RepID=UPI0008F7FBE0|nr:DUF2335 domain-containing protein [Roseinatronobacter thiooxidans]
MAKSEQVESIKKKDTVANAINDAEDDQSELAGEVVDEDTDSTSLQRFVQSAMYAGPLPPPQMLREYENILPGMANRIMTMAEEEQGIRSRDNWWLVFNDFARISGSVIVSLGLVAGAIYCAIIDQPAVAIALAASGLIPQIIKFFNGKREK